LIADDKVILKRTGQSISLSCPAPLRGLIEARCVGLLHADAEASAILSLVVDMDQVETDRMPPHRDITFFDQKFPLLHNVASQHFPAAIIQYLKRSGVG